MNFATGPDQRLHCIATSKSNHLLDNSDSVMAEKPSYVNESSNYHIPAASLRTPAKTDTFHGYGYHEYNLVCANGIVPTAAQLNLVHDRTEFYLEEYPMQLYSEGIVAESINESQPDNVAVKDGGSMEIVPTEFREILEPANFPLQNTKHEKKTMPKNKMAQNHSQFKRNRRQANIKPLHPSFASNQQATLYKVVGPGKICARLLLNNICLNSSGILEKTTNAIAMAQPMPRNPVKRAREDAVLETKSSLTKRRLRREHVFNATGVKTRSGRLSKPSQVLTNGFVCRLIKETHDQQQQPSCENDTFHEERFHLEENKENPEHNVANFAPATTRRKAKVQPQYQCGTCHKTYLGRRMNRHLHAYPTHVTLDKLEGYETKLMVSIPAAPASPLPVLHDPTLAPPTQLYRLLVDLVTAPEKESNQRAILLGEISQFVGLVRSRVPSLIVPSEQEDNETVYVDQNVADVLQLNPGNYRIRMDAFVQDREKFLQNGGFDNNKSCPASVVIDAAEQEKDPDSANVSFELDGELTAVSSFEALLQDIAELEQREQQGLLESLPLLLSKDRNGNENPKANVETMGSVPAPTTATTAFSEPAVMSYQSTTAFGRLCQLSEELFPSQSQEVLQAFEELTNLSELCSPQVLGVPGGAATNESSSALTFE